MTTKNVTEHNIYVCNFANYLVHMHYTIWRQQN